MIAIRCPKCQTRYRVPDEVAGKRTQCKKCGQPFRVPQPRPPALESAEELRLADPTALENGRPVNAPTPAGPPPLPNSPVTTGQPPIAAQAPTWSAAATLNPYQAYLRSILQSLAFPTRPGDLVTALILCLLLLACETLAPFALYLGSLMAFIITGWYWSFQFNVVQDAAAGEEDLPTLAFTGGWWDDIIVPFFKMLLINVLAVLPLIAFLVISGAFVTLAEEARSGNSASLGSVLTGHLLNLQTLTVAALLLLGGFFLWPMFVLVVAVGGVGGLLRVDLMIRTILNSFPGYLIAVVAVYVSIGVQNIADVIVEFFWGQTATVQGTLALRAVLVPIEVYFTIVAMRTVGLYYHHFKERFAWSWG